MPEFEFQSRRFNNPVELALYVVGGKWKMPILWRLKDRPWRYGELRADLKRATHKTFTQQLRELERAGLVTRTVFPVVPPKVEYAITPLGRTALPAIESLRDWGALYRRRAPRKRAQERLLALRGKVKFSIDLDKLREDRA